MRNAMFWKIFCTAIMLGKTYRSLGDKPWNLRHMRDNVVYYKTLTLFGISKLQWHSTFLLQINFSNLKCNLRTHVIEPFLWKRSQLNATDKSILVQVMAWCHQATSHYLSKCWPRSKSPYGVTRSQWIQHKRWAMTGHRVYLQCQAIEFFPLRHYSLKIVSIPRLLIPWLQLSPMTVVLTCLSERISKWR